jgi:hypothetical protein
VSRLALSRLLEAMRKQKMSAAGMKVAMRRRISIGRAERPAMIDESG